MFYTPLLHGINIKIDKTIHIFEQINHVKTAWPLYREIIFMERFLDYGYYAIDNQMGL